MDWNKYLRRGERGKSEEEDSVVTQTTRADAQLSCLGSGRYKDWRDIRACGEAIKIICSTCMLRDM